MKHIINIVSNFQTNISNFQTPPESNSRRGAPQKATHAQVITALNIQLLKNDSF